MGSISVDVLGYIRVHVNIVGVKLFNIRSSPWAVMQNEREYPGKLFGECFVDLWCAKSISQ